MAPAGPGSSPSGTRLIFSDFWAGQVGRGMFVLANASTALALSAHTLRVQLSVGACWCFRSG